MLIRRPKTIVDFGCSCLNKTNTMKSVLSGKNRKISVVVPVYNEIDNIQVFHVGLISALERIKRPYEIIYIDDNSNDGTFTYLQNLSDGYKTKAIHKKGE